jgi:hypothetical protein
MPYAPKWEKKERERLLHQSPPLEMCDSPDQAAQYHILAGFICD